MGSFMGGSAPAMARQIAQGYSLVSAPMLKRLTIPQMDQLVFELDKKLRAIRAEPIDLEEQEKLQLRNRTLSRIEGSLRMIKGTIQEKRRRGIR